MDRCCCLRACRWRAESDALVGKIQRLSSGCFDPDRGKYRMPQLKQRLFQLIQRSVRVGALASDSDDERIKKGVVTLTAAIIAVLAILWGGLYLAMGLVGGCATPLCGYFVPQHFLFFSD